MRVGCASEAGDAERGERDTRMRTTNAMTARAHYSCQLSSTLSAAGGRAYRVLNRNHASARGVRVDGKWWWDGPVTTIFRPHHRCGSAQAEMNVNRCGCLFRLAGGRKQNGQSKRVVVVFVFVGRSVWWWQPPLTAPLFMRQNNMALPQASVCCLVRKASEPHASGRNKNNNSQIKRIVVVVVFRPLCLVVAATSHSPLFMRTKIPLPKASVCCLVRKAS